MKRFGTTTKEMTRLGMTKEDMERLALDSVDEKNLKFREIRQGMIDYFLGCVQATTLTLPAPPPPFLSLCTGRLTI